MLAEEAEVCSAAGPGDTEVTVKVIPVGGVPEMKATGCRGCMETGCPATRVAVPMWEAGPTIVAVPMGDVARKLPPIA